MLFQHFEKNVLAKHVGLLMVTALILFSLSVGIVSGFFLILLIVFHRVLLLEDANALKCLAFSWRSIRATTFLSFLYLLQCSFLFVFFCFIKHIISFFHTPFNVSCHPRRVFPRLTVNFGIHSSLMKSLMSFVKSELQSTFNQLTCFVKICIIIDPHTSCRVCTIA